MKKHIYWILICNFLGWISSESWSKAKFWISFCQTILPDRTLSQSQYTVLKEISSSMSWNEDKRTGIQRKSITAEAMTPWRTKTTNHNNNGRALGLNKRALDFCFNKCEAHILRFSVIFFLLPKKLQKPRIDMILMACVSSTLPNRLSQLDLKLWFLSHISTDASSFGAISSEMGPESHRYPRQKCRTKMWDLPKFLKIGQWRHVSWRHCTDKTVYDPDWSIIIINSKLNLIFFSKYGVVESSNEVTRSM